MPDPRPIELHPLEPFLPSNARLLMLGSFPPQRIRWSMDFYYPNLQNDMWRIMGLIFHQDRDHFLAPDRRAFDEERVRAFCTDRGIALSDTAHSVIRLNNNASDKFLEVVTTLPLADLLASLPECNTLVTTGEKATDTLLELIHCPLKPAVGSYSVFSFQERPMRLYRMPSSSRAYPKPLTEKAAAYAEMFRSLGML